MPDPTGIDQRRSRDLGRHVSFNPTRSPAGRLRIGDSSGGRVSRKYLHGGLSRTVVGIVGEPLAAMATFASPVPADLVGPVSRQTSRSLRLRECKRPATLSLCALQACCWTPASGSFASKLVQLRTGGNGRMNKKEINSPWLTANFVIWFCGVGCVALLLFLGHYVWRVF